MRILELAIKDLRQVARDRQSAFFLLIMPVAFTLLFGAAFGGFGGDEAADPRLPVALLSADAADNTYLLDLLATSAVIRVETRTEDEATLRDLVDEGELAALILVPTDFYASLTTDRPESLVIVAPATGATSFAIQGEVGAAAGRLNSAVQTAVLSSELAAARDVVTTASERAAYFDAAVAATVAGWAEPPVRVNARPASAIVSEQAEAEATYSDNAFAHSSPGMMAQFTLAGLISAAQVLIAERKSGSLRRLLTTNMSRPAILLGHFLAMFIMVVAQILILVLFGQLFLDLPYFREPAAVLLLIGASALFAASMGLLIGALARSEEQAVIFSLVPMFVFAGLGGAWLPLEFTPAAFQRIAYLTPVAWMMDGFKDLIVRGLGLESVLVAVGVLAAYGVLFWLLAAWRFKFE